MTWTIDKARGVARLDPADVQPGGIELPLRPMLGCVGVAPARKEAISSATPGNFGGNMDYAWLNPGVKVMLPVYEPGALLFMGDGHARQGEGEVVGTGLETSMDVEFTVQLVKKKAIGWPRIENETHIIVSRSAARCSAFRSRPRSCSAGSSRIRDDRARRRRSWVRPASMKSPTSSILLYRRGEDSQDDAAAPMIVNGRTHRWPERPVVWCA